MLNTFNALVLNKVNDSVSSSVKELNVVDLPEGDVVINVEYSTLNYKDGLILSGLGGLVPVDDPTLGASPEQPGQKEPQCGRFEL